MISQNKKTNYFLRKIFPFFCLLNLFFGLFLLPLDFIIKVSAIESEREEFHKSATVNDSGTNRMNTYPSTIVDQPVTFTITGDSLINDSAKYATLMIPAELTNTVKPGNLAKINATTTTDFAKMASMTETLVEIANLKNLLESIDNHSFGNPEDITFDLTQVKHQLELLDAFQLGNTIYFDQEILLDNQGQMLSVDLNDGLDQALATNLLPMLLNLSTAVNALEATAINNTAEIPAEGSTSEPAAADEEQVPKASPSDSAATDRVNEVSNEINSAESATTNVVGERIPEEKRTETIEQAIPEETVVSTTPAESPDKNSVQETSAETMNQALITVKTNLTHAIEAVVTQLQRAGSGDGQLAAASVLQNVSIEMPTLISGPGAQSASLAVDFIGNIVNDPLSATNVQSVATEPSTIYFSADAAAEQFSLTESLPLKLDFGVHQIQTSEDETFTAIENGEITTATIGINDTRSKVKNWALKVSQSTAWTNQAEAIDNASLTIVGGAINSDIPMENVSSISGSEATLRNGEQQSVLAVNNTSATGQVDLALSRFDLTIPKNTPKQVGSYQTTLTWTLSDSP